MIWLKTFGNPVLYDENGEPIGGAARHRRTIGVLSVLVVSGEAGLTRDKLAGLLWPEFDQKRARHSLTQALYAARKATGQDALFDAGDDIRLNFEWIGSDARDFELLLRAGDDASAADLYRGPFLDGFFLRSGEFDMWLTHERGRFENLAVGALERAMVRAEAEGAPQQAAEYARGLNSLRPTDASAVINLMRLLAQAGDRAAALEQARRYAAIVREQYEMAPDESVVSYAQQMVEEQQQPTPALLGITPDRQDAGPSRVVHPATAMSAPPLEKRRVRIPIVVGALGGLALLVVAAAMLLRRDATPPPLTPVSHQMVIAPFRVGTADPLLGYLSEGMIELLATRLADDSTDRAMDAGALIRAWRSRDRSRDNGSREPPGLDATLAVARELGAERVVVGSVLGVPRRVILNASVVTAATGAMIARASVEGSADTLTALVDALARKLLLAQEEPNETLAARMTTSLPALRAYVRGSGAYARGDYAQAQQLYGTSLAIDSAFPLAALKLGMTAGRLADFEMQRIAYDRAWQLRNNLSDKDRAFLDAQLGPRYPRPTPLREVISAWNRAARLAPDRTETWVGLAATLFEFQTAFGTADFEPVIAALQRALQLDPAYVHANVLLRQVGIDQNAATVAHLTEVAARSARPFLMWWRAAGNDSAARQIRDSLASFGPANLRAIALASHYAGAPEDGRAAVEVLLKRAGTADEAMNLLAASHSLALNLGNAENAADATRRMERLRPAGRAHLRLRILDALYQTGDTLGGATSARELETMTATGLPSAAADECVLAQWFIFRQDMPRAQSLVASLREQPAEPPNLAAVQPAACVVLLEAEIAVATAADDAAERVELFTSSAFVTSGAADLAAYANIAAANMYRRLNAPDRALRTIRRRPYGALVWPRYHSASMRVERALCALPSLREQCGR